MALIEVKVPQLSESVAEATLLQWKKKPGEAVAADEILIEIETDKVVLEVPAPAAGVIGQIVKADGATVVADAAAAVGPADIVFKIQRPMLVEEGTDELALLRQGQVLMSPLGALTNKDLVAALAARGVACAPIQTVDQVMTHPQVLANDLRVRAANPDGSTQDLVGTPFKLAEGGGTAATAAPDEMPAAGSLVQ